MFKRFLKAMEYRSYCMSIKQLRDMGELTKANEISEFKHMIVRCDGELCDNIGFGIIAIFAISVMYISLSQL